MKKNAELIHFSRQKKFTSLCHIKCLQLFAYVINTG